MKIECMVDFKDHLVGVRRVGNRGSFYPRELGFTCVEYLSVAARLLSCIIDFLFNFSSKLLHCPKSLHIKAEESNESH
jgi:hypothetical protein